MQTTDRTEAQKEASRQNGCLGRGPTSEAGKQRSSQNSTKHGLYSSRVVLANESQQAFDELLQELLDEYNPVGPTENHLLQDMVVSRWKIRRIENMEAAAYDTEMFIHHESFNRCFQPNDPAMRHHDAALSIRRSSPGLLDFYERSLQRLQRTYSRARADLERIQTRRLRQAATQPQPEMQPPTAQEASALQQDGPVSANEPEILQAPASPSGKTYVEPEQFTRFSVVDYSYLNPVYPLQPKTPPEDDGFSQPFQPAA